MGKLWQKNYTLNELIEQFTVGDDYILDRKLVNADCVASMAHAEMLNSIGILSGRDYLSLKRELNTIIEKNKTGDFSISRSDEDCHTAIENHLTETLGDIGKKIHTGRSRNDQVIAALRLYSRDFLLKFQKTCLILAQTLVDFAKNHEHVPMPGRTHMRIAMPSSVGLWAAAFLEALLDDMCLLNTAYRINNSCPLGSAASYGVPLKLDRQRVARNLAFPKVQNNVLYVNNSRGKTEAIILDALDQVMLSLSKLAQDVILFTMSEFKYFTLPQEMCTGSSLMPQKRNPAMLELIRAKSATVSARASQIKGIIRSLPSGYNRDYQETKAAFMDGIQTSLSSVKVMTMVVEKLEVNEKNLLKGFIPEIYATDRALDLVAQGMPFRDAYREVASNLDKLKEMDPYQAIQKKNYPGAPGNLNLQESRLEIERINNAVENEEDRVNKTILALAGSPVYLFQ